MSFFWEMAKLAFEVQVQKAYVQSQKNKIIVNAEVKEKPILPFGPDDLIGKDGSHLLIVASTGLGKSNLFGHIERMFLPLVEKKELTLVVDDPKGDLLEYLSDYPKEML